MIKVKKYKIFWLGAGLLVAGALFLLVSRNSHKKVEFTKAPEENSSVPVNSNPDEANTTNTTDKTDGTNMAGDNNSSPNQTPSPSDKNNNSDNSSASSSTPKIISRLVSWGFQASSGRKIDTIIIHSTYNAVGSDPFDLDDIINKEYKPNGVSPHYIINRGGNIYQLVADKNIAYHAGESKMPDGRTNVNDFSIGIEIITSKTTSPTGAQYGALKNLISRLKGKYSIKYVLGHKDIAPGRKDDPWNFDWSKIK